MIDTKKYVWISNPEIHKEAKTSIHEFLKKTSQVKMLRAQWYWNFSFYPTSKEECQTNLKLWDYLNKNRNVLNGNYYVFNIGFPKSIYQFLKHTKRSKVLNPVIFGIAALYALQPEKRDVLRSQIYLPIYEKALIVVDKYFDKLLNINHNEMDFEIETGYFQRYYQNVRDILDSAFRDYVGNSIIFPFVNPFESAQKYEFAMREQNDFDIKLPYAYMREDDWKRIIKDGEVDSLQRAESNTELYNIWKEDLMKYHANIDTRIYQNN